MGLNAFTQTADRSRVVDYSTTMLFSDYFMIMRRPSATNSLFMGYPFTAFTWLGLIASILGV